MTVGLALLKDIVILDGTGTTINTTALPTSIALLRKDILPFNFGKTVTIHEFVIVSPEILPVLLIEVTVRVVQMIFSDVLVI